MVFEVGENYGNCTKDYLRISEVSSLNSIQSVSQENLCGSKLPSPIISRENALHIFFHTDGSTVKALFKIEAQAFDGGTIIHMFKVIIRNIGRSP